MQEGMEGNPAAGTMKNISRGFAVLSVPLTMSFPKVNLPFSLLGHNIFMASVMELAGKEVSDCY